jgi:hypothetical protein
MVIPYVYVGAMRMPIARASSSSKKRRNSYSTRPWDSYYYRRKMYNMITNSNNGVCNDSSNIYGRHKPGYDVCMEEKMNSISDLPESLYAVKVALDNGDISNSESLLHSWIINYPQYGNNAFELVTNKMDEDKRRRQQYVDEDRVAKRLKEEEQQRKDDEETQKYRSENFENRYGIFYMGCAYFLHICAKEIALSYNNYRRIKPLNTEGFIFEIIFNTAYRLFLLYIFYCILRCFPRLYE